MSTATDHVSRVTDVLAPTGGSIVLFGVSLANIALFVTIAAGLGSLTCTAIAVYKFAIWLKERR